MATLADWIRSTAAAWTDVVRARWAQAVDQARDLVAREPELAQRRAQEMCDLLWGPLGCYRRAAGYAQWARTRIEAGQELEVLEVQRKMASATGLPMAECAPGAVQRRLDELAAGIVQDVQAPEVGFLPALAAWGTWQIVVAGSAAAVSIGAVCWAWVRSADALVEHQRLSLLDRLGASDLTEGELQALAQVATGTQRPASDSIPWSGLLAGGVALLAVAGVARWAAR